MVNNNFNIHLTHKSVCWWLHLPQTYQLESYSINYTNWFRCNYHKMHWHIECPQSTWHSFRLGPAPDWKKGMSRQKPGTELHRTRHSQQMCKRQKYSILFVNPMYRYNHINKKSHSIRNWMAVWLNHKRVQDTVKTSTLQNPILFLYTTEMDNKIPSLPAYIGFHGLWKVPYEVVITK